MRRRGKDEEETERKRDREEKTYLEREKIESY